MPVRSPFRQLNRVFSFGSAEEALPFVAEMAARSDPGTATVVLLDNRRRLCDLLVVTEGGAEHLAEVLEGAVLRSDARARYAILLTDRSGEPLADRPDDELQWMELVELARSEGLVLLDWFVTYGMRGFSVAEFAPLPAQW